MNFEKRNFDCLVNFPIDIVLKREGEKKKKKQFYFCFSDFPFGT